MMSRLRAFLSVVVLSSCVHPARLAAAPEAAVERLRADLQGAHHTTFSPEDGAVVAIGLARLRLPGSGEAPAEAVRQWILDHAEAFGLDPQRDALTSSSDEALSGGWHRVTLVQRHEGLPVLGGDARAILDADGRLRSLQSGVVRGPWPAGTAFVRPGEARRRVEDRLPDLEAGSVQVELAWASDERGPTLVWCVRGVRDGRPSTSWVSATDASEPMLEQGAVHAAGWYYPQDPTGPLQETTLRDLLPGEGLASPWYGVTDNLVRPIVPFAPGDYRYAPSDSMFDQVNAFALAQHYVNDELRGRLGWTGPREPFVVRVHYPTSPYAALTSGRFVQLSGPIPGFVREVSRAADVVVHELTHAMIYDHGILATGPNREAGALHEGLADYFAAVVTGDVRIGEWLYPNFPQGATRVDQPLPLWNVANYDHVAFAGGDAASVWGNGMILSSALWDLRRALGATADSLALEALDYLPSQPTWVMFGNALLQADADRHGERNASTIFRVLAARGWRGGVVEAAFTGPTELAPGVAGTFVARPCCSGLYRGHYLWSVREWCRGAPCEDWRSIGDAETLAVALERDAEIGLRVTSAWGDTVAAAPLFVNVSFPTLRVVGPTQVVKGTESLWRASVTAAGPYQVYWSRRNLVAGAIEVPVAQGLELRARFDQDAELRVELRDARGRSTTERRTVTVAADRPPSSFVSEFRVAPPVAVEGGRFESRVELPVDARLEMRVYDARGALRALVRDAQAARGAQVLRWDGSGLGSGVYFLEARAGGERRAVRFVVVR